MGFIRRKEPAKRPRLARGGARDPFEHLHAEREQFEDEEPWFLAGDDGAGIEVQAGVSSNLNAADLVDTVHPDTSPTATDALTSEGTPRRNDPLDDLFASGSTVGASGDGAPPGMTEAGETAGSAVSQLPPLPSTPAPTDIFDDAPGQPEHADLSAIEEATTFEEAITFEPPPGPRHLASETDVEQSPAEPLFAPGQPGHVPPVEPEEADEPGDYERPRHFAAEERSSSIADDDQPMVEQFVPTEPPAPPGVVEPEELNGDRLDISHLIEGPPLTRPGTQSLPSALQAESRNDAFPPAPVAEEPSAPSPAFASSPGSETFPAPSFDTGEPVPPAPLAEQDDEVPTAPSGQLESTLVASFRDLVAHQGPAPAAPQDDDSDPDTFGDQVDPAPEFPSDRVEPRRPRRAPRRPRGF